jgi:hypothetical protein
MFDEQDDTVISWDFTDPEDMFLHLIPFLNKRFKLGNESGIIMENRTLRHQISN